MPPTPTTGPIPPLLALVRRPDRRPHRCLLTANTLCCEPAHAAPFANLEQDRTACYAFSSPFGFSLRSPKREWSSSTTMSRDPAGNSAGVTPRVTDNSGDLMVSRRRRHATVSSDDNPISLVVFIEVAVSDLLRTPDSLGDAVSQAVYESAMRPARRSSTMPSLSGPISHDTLQQPCGGQRRPGAAALGRRSPERRGFI
jgi:hypothetical protein